MVGNSQKHFLADTEEDILETWQKEKTFEKSLESRKDGPRFNFYDGPPFANGIPHYGHLEQTTIKDTVTRYKTMRGYYVERRLGWDTHGLPIEYAIEKQHDFKSKKDIVTYGIDKFNQECRDSVFMYKDVWEKMYKRVGRWADYDNSYSTMDESYMESVWWVFKTVYDKGLVYKDFRSSPYCPRCATPLSNFELNQGYQDNIKDPSLYVKFKLADSDAYLLGWTTTPWSLPGNAAIAVNPEAKYVYVSLKDETRPNGEVLIVARDRVSELNIETYEIVKELYGKDLVGLSYEPLFKLSNLDDYSGKENLYKVWAAEFVSIDEGSGILHVAPAFGEDDLMLAKQHNIPVLITVDENGHIIRDKNLSETFAGKFFKSADNAIIECLTLSGNVYAAEHLLHTYPFCWRCDTPLLYYATDSWMVKVTEIKDKLIANNQKINWVPAYIRDGRFGNWLEQARDWAISRNRFWGAPLPIWITDDGEIVVIGSVAELKKLAVDPGKVTDLHRPYIDDVVIKTASGKLAKRIPEVFDVWFESGSMPYGEDHFPFEPNDNPEEHFSADFIAEAIDQTRGWFYTLHVLSTALFNKPAFKNVICSGWIVAADGEKLSKRKKNYAPMDEVFDQYGVDTLRFFMSSSPLMNGEDTRFSVDFLRDVQRKIFLTLQNTYNFYKLYADVDGWKPKGLEEPISSNILDTWIISRVNQSIELVTKELDSYKLDRATRPITDLIDDLSNWYVRRSRRRFWKSQDDEDKQNAYATLYFALMRICQLLAPFSPFLVDDIWRKLRPDDQASSVHLSDWPGVGSINEDVIKKMDLVRAIITNGLSKRAEAGIKVRQPLASATIHDKDQILDDEELKQLIIEEINVKELKVESNKTNSDNIVDIDTTLSGSLLEEGLIKDLIRYIQSARKTADLNVDDRIELSLIGGSKLFKSAVKNYEDLIKRETLALSVKEESLGSEKSLIAKLDGEEVEISLKKSSK